MKPVWGQMQVVNHWCTLLAAETSDWPSDRGRAGKVARAVLEKALCYCSNTGKPRTVGSLHSRVKVPICLSEHCTQTHSFHVQEKVQGQSSCLEGLPFSWYMPSPPYFSSNTSWGVVGGMGRHPWPTRKDACAGYIGACPQPMKEQVHAWHAESLTLSLLQGLGWLPSGQ